MRKKAFTLIEILIVLFVFGTGILGVLNVLTHSLAYFDTISTKTKASFLAKEGLEIAYNFRDSKLEEGFPWNYFTGNCPNEHYLGSGEYSIFKIGLSTGSNPYWVFEKGEKPDPENFNSYFNRYLLEIYTGNTNGASSGLAYYVYATPHEVDAELPAKGFARYVEFLPIYVNEDKTASLDTNRIVKISSHALYKRGSLTGEIVLESFIGMKDAIPADPTCE